MQGHLGEDYRSKEEKNSMTIKEIHEYQILMERRAIEDGKTIHYKSKYTTPAWKEVKVVKTLIEWSVRIFMDMTDNHTSIGSRLEKMTPNEISTLWRKSDTGRIKVLDIE